MCYCIHYLLINVNNLISTYKGKKIVKAYRSLKSFIIILIIYSLFVISDNIIKALVIEEVKNEDSVEESK